MILVRVQIIKVAKKTLDVSGFSIFYSLED